jgi:hypothetical protein
MRREHCFQTTALPPPSGLQRREAQLRVHTVAHRTAKPRRGTITAVFRYFRDLRRKQYLIGLIVVILAILSFFGLR